MIAGVQYEKVAEEYFSRWDCDDLSDPIYANVAGPQPQRSFREFVLAMWEIERNWNDDPRLRGNRAGALSLEATTVAEFMQRSVVVDGVYLPIERVAYLELCLPTVTNAAAEVLGTYSLGTDGGEARYRQDLAACGFTPDAFTQALESGAVAEALGPGLWIETLNRYGHRRLLSYFVRERSEEGWYEWWPESFIGNRDRTDLVPRSRSAETSFGQLTVRTCRRYVENAVVGAVEWEGRLADANGEATAYAVGTVYLRKRGVRRVAGEDVFFAADEVSDHDAAVVHELIKPGGPLDEPALDSDLLLVWIWERRQGAASGSGAACLASSIELLRSSYKGVRSIVIDARPRQFVVWSVQRDHPEVARLRIAATERVCDRIRHALGTAPSGKLVQVWPVYPVIDEHPTGVNFAVGRVAAEL